MKDYLFNWDVCPEILWITDSFPLRYYGLLFISGLLMGYYVVRKIYIREKISVDNLDTLLLYIIVGTIMGARLGHCFFYEIYYFIKNPLEILLPIRKIANTYKFIGFQGLSSHGGAIGILISIVFYSIKYKTNFLWILDRIAIAIPITAAFIRIGNLMNSEMYGKTTSGNWGMIFRKVDSIPRHPTQIYESVCYFLIFIFLIYNTSFLKMKRGLVFGLLLTLLFSIRIIIEFFKENQENFENKLFINMGQILSIPFLIIGLVLIFRKKTTEIIN